MQKIVRKNYYEILLLDKKTRSCRDCGMCFVFASAAYTNHVINFKTHSFIEPQAFMNHLRTNAFWYSEAVRYVREHADDEEEMNKWIKENKNPLFDDNFRMRIFPEAPKPRQDEVYDCEDSHILWTAVVGESAVVAATAFGAIAFVQALRNGSLKNLYPPRYESGSYLVVREAPFGDAVKIIPATYAQESKNDTVKWLGVVEEKRHWVKIKIDGEVKLTEIDAKRPQRYFDCCIWKSYGTKFGEIKQWKKCSSGVHQVIKPVKEKGGRKKKIIVYYWDDNGNVAYVGKYDEYFDDDGNALAPGVYDMSVQWRGKRQHKFDQLKDYDLGDTREAKEDLKTKVESILSSLLEKTGLKTEEKKEKSFSFKAPCVYTSYAHHYNINHQCKKCNFNHERFMDKSEIKEFFSRFSPKCKFANCRKIGCPFEHVKEVSFRDEVKPKVWKKKEQAPKPETLQGGAIMKDFWSSAYSSSIGRVFMTEQQADAWGQSYSNCTLVSGRVYFPHHTTEWKGKYWLTFKIDEKIIKKEIDVNDCESADMTIAVGHLLSTPAWPQLIAQFNATRRMLTWKKTRSQEAQSLIIPIYGFTEEC